MRRKGLHKPKSRVVSALLALFMLIGSTTAIVTVTSAPPAHADTGNYSWPTAPCAWSPHATTGACSGYDWGLTSCPSGDGYCTTNNEINGYYQYDNWGYGFRNCTSYVAEKISQEFSGRSVAGWGNAANWATAAQAAHYTLDPVSSPQVGDIAVWGTEVGADGHVAYVASVSNGVATFDEYNVAGTGAYTNSYTSTNHPGAQAAPNWYIHMGTPADGSGSGGGSGPISSLPDGTYIQATDGNQNVYVMAGGSPMLVYAWANVGGQQIISYTYTSTQISQQGLMYPRDGTVVRDAKTGALFVVAGGFPFGVTSTSAVPSSYSSSSVYVNVDGNAITNGLRSQPADGTSIRDFSNGNPYVISGGAPVYVHDPTTVPYTNWVDIDHWDLANELKPYPTDGSVVIDNYSNVYVMAGGAPMKTMSTNTIPPYSSFAYVDNWTIANLFPAFPRNGTMVQDYVSQHIYVVAGGSLMLVSSLNNVPYTSWVVISDWSIANEFLQYPEDGTVIQDYVHKTVYIVVGGSPLYVTSSNAVPPADMTNAVPIDPNSFSQLLGYPLNGTFVVGYVSGRVYQIQNQAAVYIGNSSLITSTPIPVDDWAITNELHGS